jgi:NTE family protein
MSETSIDPVEEQRRRQLLAQCLRANFGDAGPDTLAVLRDNMQWQPLHAGEVLMRQGDPGDAVYLTLSGRLRVYLTDEQGNSHQVRELGRGEITGEMSLFSGGPRSATVVAIRDTLLARLNTSDFMRLLTHAPQVSIAMTQKVIERLQTQHLHHASPAPVMITLQPISDGVDTTAFAQQLCDALSAHGRVCWVDEASLRALAPGPSGQAPQDLAVALDALEANQDFVLLVSDAAVTPWSALCSRHCDEMLLLAHAADAPVLHPVEQATVRTAGGHSEAAETLVLLHPADTQQATGMALWLARRPVADHLHLRPGLARDMQRLARLLSRQAIGLVLAGGGARGFSHLGVWQVLRENGIEIDCVGGTSIGAVMSALIAADADCEQTIEVARQAFRGKPTGDYNWLPMISLMKGRRWKRVLTHAIGQLMGGPTDMVDLWKGYYCIASNYSKGQELVFRQGDLCHGLLSSTAVAGAMPPVIHDGDLLCDGATFNNFPTNIMRTMRGVGHVIGVDLSANQARRITFDDIPGTWALLLDKLKPRSQRRYKMPSLTTFLLNVPILYSISRQAASRGMVDLYFNPPLQRVGLMQWDRFEDILARGRAHAQEVLSSLPAQERARWGLRPAPDA